MKTKTQSYIKIYYILLIIGIVILAATGSSYARSNLYVSQGDTEFARVRSVDENYLTTTEGRFAIIKDTKIYDEHGTDLSYRDIKKSSLVRMRFKRTGGQLVALDIVVKTSEIEKQPQ